MQRMVQALLHRPPVAAHYVAAADVAEGPVAEAGVEAARVLRVAGARLAKGDDRSQLAHQPGSPAGGRLRCLVPGLQEQG